MKTLCIAALAPFVLSWSARLYADEASQNTAFASYYLAILLQDQAGDLDAQARAQIAERHPTLDVREVETPPVDRACVWTWVLPPEEFGKPTPDWIAVNGRGLTPEQIEWLPDTRGVWILEVHAPSTRAVATLRAVEQLVHGLAADRGGVIYDGATREYFSVEAWSRSRVERWHGDLPDVAWQTTLHVYSPGDEPLFRIISLGMRKFALPDVVATEVARSNWRAVNTLANLGMQTMVESGIPAAPGDTLNIDIRALRHDGVRERALQGIIGDGAGRGAIALGEADREDGDPNNRLISLTFGNYDGASINERHGRAIKQILGTVDTYGPVKHSDEVLAARDRARSQLPRLREHFNAGLAPAEHIIVKAPFPTAVGGTEWMWVEVTAWKDGEIHGVLQNEPREVPDLNAGARVTVREEGVFDYLHYKPDGTEEGNETGKLMRPNP